MKSRDNFIQSQRLWLRMLLVAFVFIPIFLSWELRFSTLFYVIIFSGAMAGLVSSYYQILQRLLKKIFFIEIGIFGIVIWVVWRFVFSKFLYEELTMIIIKGLLGMVMLLCFGAGRPRVDNYLRCISLLIFLALIPFVNLFSLVPLILGCGYIFVWMVQSLLVKADDSRISRDFIRTSIFFLVGIGVLSGVIGFKLLQFYTVKLPKRELSWSLRTQEFHPQERFYRLQRELFEKTRDMFPSGSDEKSKLLKYLTQIVNEQISVQRADQARQGLLDLFFRAGPGLLEDFKEKEKLLSEYVSENIERRKREYQNTVSQGMISHTLPFMKRFAAAKNLQTLRSGQSLKSVRQSGNELQEMVSNILFPKKEEPAVREAIRDLQLWNIYSLYTQKRQEIKQMIEPLPPSDKVYFTAQLDKLERETKLDKLLQMREDYRQLRVERAATSSRKKMFGQFMVAANLKYEWMGQEKTRELLKETALADSYPKIDSLFRECMDAATAEEFRAYTKEFDFALQREDSFPIELRERMDRLLENKRVFLLQQQRALYQELLATHIHAPLIQESLRLEMEEFLNQNTRSIVAAAQKLKSKIQQYAAQGAYLPQIQRQLEDTTDEMRLLVQSARHRVIQESVLEQETSAISENSEGIHPQDKHSSIELLRVIPEELEVPVGIPASLVVEAVYSHGKVKEVTDSVIWNVRNAGLCEIDHGRVVSLQPGFTTVTAQLAGMESNLVSLTITKAVITVIKIESAQERVGLGDTLGLRVSAAYSDGSQKEIRDDIVWAISPSGKAAISAQGQLSPKVPGKITVTAHYREYQSLPLELELFIPSYMIIFLLIGGLVILGGVAFGILYIRYTARIRRLSQLLVDDPSHFIQSFYFTVCKILEFFSLKYHRNMPFHKFAAMVDQQSQNANFLFSRFTTIFTKIRYSRYHVTVQDIHKYIALYRDFSDFLEKTVPKVRWLKVRLFIAGYFLRFPVFYKE